MSWWPSTGEVEAGRLEVHPGLHSEFEATKEERSVLIGASSNGTDFEMLKVLSP